MKKFQSIRFILLALIMLSSVTGFSQNRNKEILKKLDTISFKPKVKMLGINKVDNTVVYWNGSYWTIPSKNDSTWSLIVGPLGRRKMAVDSIH